MTTVLLLNPSAGGGRANAVATTVLSAARKAWGDVELLRTSGPRDAVGLARKAAEDGVERLVVIGGDGTIHEAANGFLATGIKTLPQLAVVPIGTGNDFARLTGTHGLSPAEAVRRLAAGGDELFDVGLAWGEYFVNTLGLGFDAVVASHVPRYRHLWRPLVYPAAVLHSWRRYRPIDVVVEGDDAGYRGGIFTIEIGVGKSTGGGFFLTPDALPNDGLFDACLIVPISFREFITLAPRAFRGEHTRLRQVRMMRAGCFQVRSAGPLLAHFDGEIRHGPETIEVRIVENRLPVMTTRVKSEGLRVKGEE